MQTLKSMFKFPYAGRQKNIIHQRIHREMIVKIIKSFGINGTIDGKDNREESVGESMWVRQPV